MNGAIADPCVSTISAPSSSMMRMMGPNQNFLRSFMKPQRSLSKSSISMVSLRDSCLDENE